ncbi:hypothetical protein ACFSQT_37570 [Mesorhizobium calcicola]|uniref:Uncharacterized protein n=1 Tax=Mesorhizobium calcicola TaxID=1300310 RepID=A0ABW4WQ02_9HYPH
MAFAVPFGSVANAEQLRRAACVSPSATRCASAASIDPANQELPLARLVRGLYDAYGRGAETALILDFNGNVAEGPGFNVFCVKAGKLSTPAIGVLPASPAHRLRSLR